MLLLLLLLLLLPRDSPAAFLSLPAATDSAADSEPAATSPDAAATAATAPGFHGQLCVWTGSAGLPLEYGGPVLGGAAVAARPCEPVDVCGGRGHHAHHDACRVGVRARD